MRSLRRRKRRREPGLSMSQYLSSLPLWELIVLVIVIPTLIAIGLQVTSRWWVGVDRLSILRIMERALRRPLTEPEEHLALEKARALGMA